MLSSIGKSGSVAFFVPHLGCPHDCSYCNQRLISGQSEPPTPEEVKTTLGMVLSAQPDKVSVMQISFFGGSFTAVDAHLRRSLLAAAAPFCYPGGFAGIRFSTRPDCISAEILEELSRYPVTDIELGVQSMNDSVLLQNYRGHTAQDVVRASALIKEAGYRLTLQMMTGLPGETPESTMQTAWQIAELRPGAVRIYPTIVLRGTMLADWFDHNLYTPPSLDEAIELCARLLDFFTKQDIPVIRMGLQENEGIKRFYVAGPYHPAFRELCEGNVLFDQIVRQANQLPPGPIYIRVRPQSLSALTGHGRRALRPLEDAGYFPIVMPDESVGYLDAVVTR